MAQIDKRPLPPYLPYRSFITYLDGLRTFVPNVIDRSSMRSFSGAIQSWLLSGLRYLKMIDDVGIPKPRLHQIAEASDEQRKPMLRQLIDAEYGFLKSIDLTRATPGELDRAFAQTGAQGDTVRKCVAFFLAMAKDAEIPLSPLLLKAHRRSSPTRSPGTRRVVLSGMNAPNTEPLSTGVQPQIAPKSRAEMLLDLLDPGSMSEEEQSAVWVLLKYLKKAN